MSVLMSAEVMSPLVLAVSTCDDALLGTCDDGVLLKVVLELVVVRLEHRLLELVLEGKSVVAEVDSFQHMMRSIS